jgi:hypothetical protein
MKMGRKARRSLTVAVLTTGCLSAHVARAQEEPKPAPSPWVLLPTFSNNPKLGTAVGGLVGYLRKFDAESKLSVFGVSAQYTSTDSATAVMFARTSFDADQHRLNAFAVGGRFIGAQAVSTDYQIVGQTALDDDLLGLLGLTGFKAGGVGLVGYHDSRDAHDSPKRGWLLNFNSVAYRQSIEGSDNFDVYRLDYRHFWSHGDGHVLAIRQSNQWTQDAPPGAFAPVLLRGYTIGEYLGKSMSSIEVEERHRLAERWGATVFAGVACLYGANRSGCSGSNLFPSVGAGVQYIVKPAQGIVANLEFAAGKDGNRAVLFKMGYAW